MPALPWLRSRPDPETRPATDTDTDTDIEETDTVDRSTSDERTPGADATDDRPERWDVREPAEIDVAEVRSLRLDLVAGTVDVLGRDEPGARIEIRSVSRAGLTVLSADGALRISQRGGAGLSGATARIAIAVQRDAALDLHVVSADALVSGLRQGQSVETTSGAALLDGTAGPARIRSVSGEIALRGHAGDVDVRTVSGEVTASGAITAFRSATVSAEVFLDAADPDEVGAESVSGDVTVRLGAARPAEYEVRTFSGRVRLDGRRVERTIEVHRSRWGDPEGPAVPVRVTSASGSVRVMHAGTE